MTIIPLTEAYWAINSVSAFFGLREKSLINVLQLGKTASLRAPARPGSSRFFRWFGQDLVKVTYKMFPFARMLSNQGVILTKIQRLLGHESVLATERYLGEKFEETREAIQMLDEPLNRILNMSINAASATKMPDSLPNIPCELIY